MRQQKNQNLLGADIVLFWSVPFSDCRRVSHESGCVLSEAFNAMIDRLCPKSGHVMFCLVWQVDSSVCHCGVK